MSIQTHFDRGSMSNSLAILALAALLSGCASRGTKMNDNLQTLTELFPTEPIPREPSVPVFEGDTDMTALDRLLSGKRWTSITYGYVRNKYPGPLSEAFCYLTGSGRAYFLPAFLH